MRQGKEIVLDTLGQSSRDWITTAEASYGLTDRFSLQATLPVISASFAGEALGVDRSQTKLGDFSLAAHYFWSFGYFAAPVMLSLGAGVNFPTGGGIENPVSSDRNFVSGTLDPIITGSLVFSIQGPLSASASFYARPILSEADDGTKTGGFIFAGVGAGYSFIFSDNSGLDFSLRASGQHRAQDKINGQPFANSGGNWVYITPGATVSLFGRGIHGLQLSTALEVPVYQYVKGSQLTEDWTLRFGLGYGFHLISGGG
ncbi:MAG: hypothetical protein L0Z48_04660 [candidate division Zixibacteria bacterium]|nr:hypothetical protein [candidate division Zixibacteria bacterium]